MVETKGYFSASKYPHLSNDCFAPWEGFFSITKSRNSYTFTFGIGLHLDDLKVIEYIQETLQMGNVYIKPGKVASCHNSTVRIKLK
jgi:hypothetical protein